MLKLLSVILSSSCIDLCLESAVLHPFFSLSLYPFFSLSFSLCLLLFFRDICLHPFLHSFFSLSSQITIVLVPIFCLSCGFFSLLFAFVKSCVFLLSFLLKAACGFLSLLCLILLKSRVRLFFHDFRSSFDRQPEVSPLVWNQIYVMR